MAARFVDGATYINSDGRAPNARISVVMSLGRNPDDGTWRMILMDDPMLACYLHFIIP